MWRASQDSRPAFVPKTWEDLKRFPALVSQSGAENVVSVTPNVLIKYGGNRREEILAMQFARNVLSLPVPKVLYHPPLRCRYNPFKRCTGVWYFAMERCPGTSLDKAIDTMSTEELDHVADQLKAILDRMATLRPKTLGSVTGGPYDNYFLPGYQFICPKSAFTSVGEFIDYYRQTLLLACTEKFTASVVDQLPRNAAIRFAHGDLFPRNIIVNESDITGVVDWSTGGFYPEYWDYAQMHNKSTCVSAGWDYVVHRIFPGPRRHVEINAVARLLSVINNTFN